MDNDFVFESDVYNALAAKLKEIGLLDQDVDPFFGTAQVLDALKRVEMFHPLTRKGLNGFYLVSQLAREDLRAAGFAGDNADDETMTALALSLCSDHTASNQFWTGLRAACEEERVPRLGAEGGEDDTH